MPGSNPKPGEDLTIKLKSGTVVTGKVYGVMYGIDKQMKHIALTIPVGSTIIIKAEDIQNDEAA